MVRDDALFAQMDASDKMVARNKKGHHPVSVYYVGGQVCLKVYLLYIHVHVETSIFYRIKMCLRQSKK